MIGYEKNFDEKRIMDKIKAPKIRQICPNEELHFGEYKSNDLTYPDVGKVTTKFYRNRPVVEHIWGKEVLNNIEKFLKINCREKDKAIKLIEELCNIPNVINYRSSYHRSSSQLKLVTALKPITCS